MVLIGSSVVLALMGVVAGTGFIVPTGLANGAYILTEDSVTPAHFATEIAARDASDHPHSPNGLFKRLDNPVTSCDGYTYNSGDYQASYRVALLFFHFNSEILANRNRMRMPGVTTPIALLKETKRSFLLQIQL